MTQTKMISRRALVGYRALFSKQLGFRGLASYSATNYPSNFQEVQKKIVFKEEKNQNSEAASFSTDTFEYQNYSHPHNGFSRLERFFHELVEVEDILEKVNENISLIHNKKNPLLRSIVSDLHEAELRLINALKMQGIEPYGNMHRNILHQKGWKTEDKVIRPLKVNTPPSFLERELETQHDESDAIEILKVKST